MTFSRSGQELRDFFTHKKLFLFFQARNSATQLYVFWMIEGNENEIATMLWDMAIAWNLGDIWTTNKRWHFPLHVPPFVAETTKSDRTDRCTGHKALSLVWPCLKVAKPLISWRQRNNNGFRIGDSRESEAQVMRPNLGYLNPIPRPSPRSAKLGSQPSKNIFFPEKKHGLNSPKFRISSPPE